MTAVVTGASRPTGPAATSLTALEDLLEQSRQLAQGLQEYLYPDIPNIDLTLNEIISCCEGIEHGTKQGRGAIGPQQEEDFTKAHYLLASSGLNLEHTAREIDAIELQEAEEPLASADFDVGAFVRQARERTVIEMLEERQRQADIEFAAFMDKHMEQSWEDTKRKLLDAYYADQANGSKDVSAGTQLQPSFTRSLAQKRAPPLPGFEDVELDSQLQGNGTISFGQREQTFAQAVASINEHRLMREPMSVCSLMAQLVGSLGNDTRTQQLTDSWNLLGFITDERHTEQGKGSTGKTLLPRRYLREYMLATPDKPDVAFNTRIVDGARRYLENQFFGLVEREILRNPQEARMGGVPSIESKVRAYANIRFNKNGQWTQQNLEIVNNTPIWVVLFYLLRAGFVEEAAAFTVKNETYLAKVEKNFASYMKAYVSNNRRLPRQLSERMYTEYTQRIRQSSQQGGSGDPFKHALYKILGRFDLTRRNLPDVLPVIEDWMWLQLALVRESSTDDPSYETFTLADLQTTLVKYGPRHFNPRDTNPLLYFQMMLMTGQFERAVHYLTSFSLVDAVHFAAVLSYFALLRIAAQTTAEATGRLLHDEDEGGVVALDFAGLMRLYAGAIERQASTAAVDYLCLICLNDDVPKLAESQRKAAHEAVRSLVLATRDFATLLGDVQPQGTRKPGYIERRMKLLDLQDERDYLYTITHRAARLADEDGRVADAILLFHLAEDYDTVVGVVNKSLGEALLDPAYLPSEGIGGNLSLSSAEDPALLAKNMIKLYSSNASIFSRVSARSKQTCDLLLKVIQARQQRASNQFEACLTTIDSLELIPIKEEYPVGGIKRLASTFQQLESSQVASIVPSLLLLASDCLRGLYTNLKHANYQDSSRQAKAQGLKKRARNLATYAGMIRLHMDASTYGALIDINW
ncbi:nuclear pore complex subunit [Savitreella phatthalungensis]